jgi:hypothetical protein
MRKHLARCSPVGRDPTRTRWEAPGRQSLIESFTVDCPSAPASVGGVFLKSETLTALLAIPPYPWLGVRGFPRFARPIAVRSGSAVENFSVAASMHLARKRGLLPV